MLSNISRTFSNAASASSNFAKKSLSKIFMTNAVGRTTASFLVSHCNKVQMGGFISFNTLLALTSTASSPLMSAAGWTYNASAAIIGFDDPKKRPQMLMLGGLALTAASAMITAAGFPLNSFMIASSLEISRGGYIRLEEHIKELLDKEQSVPKHVLISKAIGDICGLGLYKDGMESLTKRAGKVGEYLNTRPHVAGLALKIPARLELIAMGDPIAKAVGAGWFVTGDVPVALNDDSWRERIKREITRRRALKTMPV